MAAHLIRHDLRSCLPTPFGLRPFPPDRGNRPSPKGEGLRAAKGRPYGEFGDRPSRTLAGLIKNFCHSEAHPHPPRIRSAPSPLQGEGLRAAKGRPFEIRETLRPFRRGRRPRRPAGAHCAPLQRETRWERWFGKPRRGSETAPAAILEQPGPSGPAGI